MENQSQYRRANLVFIRLFRVSVVLTKFPQLEVNQ